MFSLPFVEIFVRALLYHPDKDRKSRILSITQRNVARDTPRLTGIGIEAAARRVLRGSAVFLQKRRGKYLSNQGFVIE
jgi:hypothetical protein